MGNVLYVWAYLESSKSAESAAPPTLCGSLEMLQGRRCVFAYDASWLAHPQAFALCPDMALRPGPFDAPPGLDLHPIFEDAGPDRWGKNIINKVFNPERRSALDYLELAGEDRIGALGFSRQQNVYPSQDGEPEQAFHLADLADLNRAAQCLLAQMPIDDELRRLLRPGASAGGARPKAIIRHQQQDWLAKFPTDDDDCDVAALEHATLRLAARCQIQVPASQLVKLGRKNLLLVQRFDREGPQRIHFASARTILYGEGIAEEAMAYADLADALRRWSTAPQVDCEQLFRRMAFNVMIENSDDHAKNHALLFRHRQWRLSPAYDMQPQRLAIGYQQLRIGKQGHSPTLANVLSECQRFLLSSAQARQIVDELLQTVRTWEAVFAACGMAQADIELCGRYILRADMGV